MIRRISYRCIEVAKVYSSTPPLIFKGLLTKHKYLQSDLIMSKKLSPAAYHYADLTRKIRSCFDVQDFIQVVENNFKQISTYGKTLLLNAVNQLYIDIRSPLAEDYIKLHLLLYNIKDLNHYQKTMRMTITQKMKFFYSRSNQIQKFNSLLKESENELTESIMTKKLTLYDYFNVFFIFRVQHNEKLIQKCFQQIEKRILVESFDDIYPNAIFLFFHRKFDHLLRVKFSFLAACEEVQKYYEIYLQEFIYQKRSLQLVGNMSDFHCNFPVIQIICSFKFHLIGERKISPNLKQIIQRLQPKITAIDVKTLFKLAEACKNLPVRYMVNFQNLVMKQLKYKMHQQRPDMNYIYSLMTVSDINKLYQDQEKSFNFLLNSILYQDSETYQKFMRGKIVQYFRNYILKTEANIKNLKIGQRNQVSARICCASIYFIKHQDTEILQKIKKILVYQINCLRFQSIKLLSFSNFITLFYHFEGDQLISEIKSEFYSIILKRKTKQKLFDNKFIEHCLSAIRFHIGCERDQVMEAVKILIKQVLSATKDKQERSEVEINLLFEIIKAERIHKSQQMSGFKKQLLKRFKDQEFEILFQYFLLHCPNEQSVFSELLKEFLFRNLHIQVLFKILSAINFTLLQDSKGKLLKNLASYLQNYKGNLNFGLDLLNEAKKLLTNLAYFSQSLQSFLPKLYLACLSQIYEQIKKPQFKLQHNFSRPIIDFVMKFQGVISHENLLKDKAILSKIYTIFTTLMKVELKQRLYLEAKFTQFVSIYQQYIKVEEGTQIYSAYKLMEIIGKSAKTSELTEIMLILLQLHCLGFLEMQATQAMEYSNTLLTSIENEETSIYQVQPIIKQMLYHFKIRNSKDYQLFKTLISPILHKCLKMYNHNFEFQILSPFLLYFKLTNQLHSASQYCQKLLNQNVSIATIDFFIQKYPFASIDDSLLDILINKIRKMAKFVNQNSISYLFFLQKLFFKCPEKYNQVVEIFWKKTEENLKTAIKEIANNKDPELLWRKQSMLNRYEMYMFACIKRARTQGNEIFNHLTSIIVKDVHLFENKITDSTLLKNVNRNIINFLRSQAQKQKQQTNRILNPAYRMTKQKISEQNFNNSSDIHVVDQNQTCKSLEQRLKREGATYYRNWKLKNILVPYYNKTDNEVIIIGNSRTLCLAESQVKFNGILRFQYEVLKSLLPNEKVRIYDDLREEYIEDNLLKSDKLQG